MHIQEESFRIKRENFVGALSAIKGLAGQETIRDASGRHFSWVDTRKFMEATTLREALRAWRWDVDIESDDGDAVGIMFEGEKYGDDPKLFDALAPFVEAGSYIEMLGEDGGRWRWIFDGHTCIEKQATITWD
jgi:hypothetical protein